MISGVIGHSRTLSELNRSVPQVSLLRGPKGVGKHTLAKAVADSLEIPSYLIYEFNVLDSFTVDILPHWSSIVPDWANTFAIIDIDSASRSALNDLLKLLEDPPAQHTIMLLSSGDVLDTIRSRCVEFKLGRLSQEELYEILTAKLSIAPDSARNLSNLGTVDMALSVYLRLAGKAAVMSVFRAVEQGNEELFYQASKAMDEGSADLLRRALVESSIPKWSVFQEDDLGKFANKELARKLVKAWSESSESRPEIVYKLILEPLIGRLK